MAAVCTKALRRQLVALDEEPHNFAREFDAWKARGPAGEYDSYLFGKDGAYGTPLPNSLRHVHLAPISDASALLAWDAKWSRRSRKVSNRALVYASDPTHGHLLIFILSEPSAHRVVRMQSAADAELMRKLVRIAERFVQDGVVIG